jgi:hypothetical protein
MLDVEPKALVFRDIRLNQSYTTSLCITNTLPTSVDFSLRCSSPRYAISPDRVHLSGGQSIVITVRLHVSSFPNYARGIKGQEDTIHIQSTFFEQKVDVTFFLHKRDTHVSRSLSPQNRKDISGTSDKSAIDVISELRSLLQSRDKQIMSLKEVITQFESDRPDFKEIVNNRIEQERLVFEEKSEKVCISL